MSLLRRLLKRANGHIRLGRPTPVWLDTVSTTCPPLSFAPPLPSHYDHYAPSIVRISSTGKVKHIFTGKAYGKESKVEGSGRRDANRPTAQFYPRPQSLSFGASRNNGQQESRKNDSIGLVAPAELENAMIMRNEAMRIKQQHILSLLLRYG